MRILDLASQAANMKNWPSRRDVNSVRLEVPTTGTRTQVVTVEMGRDGDGDAAGFVFAKFGDAQAMRDLWMLLRLNSELTYGKVAERNSEMVIMHAIYDETASLGDVGKAIYYVAKAADELEEKIYGSDQQ